MIPELVVQNITSIKSSRLEDMYEEYMSKNANPTTSEFVKQLFHDELITSQEYKDYQAQSKIELTSVVNFKEIDKLESIVGKLQSIPGGEEYTIVDSLDEGAMGSIHLARDNKLGRVVAYKKIHPQVAEYPTFLSRFIMEAQITAQLQHPSIVPIYSLLVQNGEIGYAMKLIDGITLKRYIQETGEQYNQSGDVDEYHSLKARLEHFLKVCDAIHYAHRKGVVHRDLKPVNIMLGHYNEVYVMDWGIAKIVQVDEETFDDVTKRIDSDKDIDKDFDKTVVGQMMGTPAYMSPEQAEGNNDTLDHRSDLYSLGLILFEVVTLYKAINGKTVDAIIAKAMQGIIDPVPSYAKEAEEQEQLMAIIGKATQYLPEHRYTTVAEFADDIRRFLHGDPIRALPDTTKQKVMRWITRHKKATINILILTLLSTLLMLGTFMYLYLDMINEMLK